MKDLIAKLQIDANCALGAIWMHIDAQAARIAELEAQIAAASALVVERQTWSHITPRDFVEVATAIMDQHGLMDDLSYEKTEKLCEDMEASFKKLLHPVQADTDKLRPCACQGYGQCRPGCDDIASTALQAPVREAPGWQIVPIEPTHEMVWAARAKGTASTKAEIWSAMLAAAPLPADPVQEPKP